MSTLSRKKLLARTKRVFRHMTPGHMVRSRMISGIIRNFADQVGMVYFGSVHASDDEHRLVRGHTVSHTHIDNHYAVGTTRGYDIALVLRNDIVLTARHHHEQRCHWLIMTIDLHTKTGLPHFYVGHRNRDSAFYASFEQLSPLYIGGLGAYPHHFTQEYTVYGQATRTIDIERVVTPAMAEVIITHFDDASFEIEDNTIYMYIESQRPTTAQLEKLLSNGLWLAEQIDTAHP